VVHCLRDCHFAREIWKAIPIGYTRHFFFTSTTNDLIKQGLQCQSPQVFMSALWWLWRWINHRIQGGNQLKKHEVIRYIYDFHEDIDHYLLGKGTNDNIRKVMRWQPPQRGLVKLDVDGSCNSHGGLVIVVLLLFKMRKVNGLLVSPPMMVKGDVLFAKLFAIYNGITLLLQLNMGVHKQSYNQTAVRIFSR